MTTIPVTQHPTPNTQNYTIAAQRGRGEGWQQQLEQRTDTNTNTITSVAKDNYVLMEPRHKHGEDRTYTTIAPCIQGRYGTGGDNVPYVVNNGNSANKVVQVNPSKESGGKQPYQHNRVYDAQHLAPTIDLDASRTNVLVGKYCRTDEAKAIRREHAKEGRDFTPFQGKEVHFEQSDVMNTVTTATTKDNIIEQNKQIRRLTEIECERLQGFPDDWTMWGMFPIKTKKGSNESQDSNISTQYSKKQIPKTQRYKLCGNAVTAKMVQKIAERVVLNP
jgi:DNA (cytosine-5)-methyltransferase 1